MRRLGAEGVLKRAIAKDPQHRICMICRIVTLDEQSGVTVVYNERETAHGGRNDGCAAGLRLERDQSEGLGSRRHEHDIRCRVEIGQMRLGLRREQHHALGHAQRRGKVHQPSHLRAAVHTARTSDEREHQMLGRSRIAGDSLG
jgi:hypothetical protein